MVLGSLILIVTVSIIMYDYFAVVMCMYARAHDNSQCTIRRTSASSLMWKWSACLSILFVYLIYNCDDDSDNCC